MKSTPTILKKIPVLHDIKQRYPGIKGLFFDMDGTLFNTEPLHTKALLRIGEKYNITPPYPVDVVHELLVGKADHLLFEIIQAWPGMPQHWSVDDFVNEKNINVIELITKTPRSNYLPPEISLLIQNAYEEGFLLALVTSSEKIVTEKLLGISGLEKYFEIILTRDDCPKHKPDPWPYLKAIELSKLNSDEIIIFEDSSVGLDSATSSAQHVIKVEWY
jgi:beta-phosphoglucomutase-like phosphatase (HAD superfamily)